MTDIHIHGFKLAALVLIFAVGMAGGLVGLGGRGEGRAALAFSIGGAFAGGIFLGAGLLHLLPDSIEALTGYFVGSNFPFGYALAAVGFLAVLFVEEILFGNAHANAAGSGAEVAAAGVSAYALVVILSVHSVLAGAALGTEDTFSGSLVIFLAIIAHKGAAGFALTLDFRRAAFAGAKSLRLLALFASMTPLGIVLGAGLDHLLQDRHGRLFEGLFDALASGTFLYVAVVEIISREFADREAILAKFGVLCAGIALMALIALWT